MEAWRPAGALGDEVQAVWLRRGDTCGGGGGGDKEVVTIADFSFFASSSGGDSGSGTAKSACWMMTVTTNTQASLVRTTAAVQKYTRSRNLTYHSSI